MKHLWQEFKSFAFKGNMIDLAVGVVIGTAFGTVIKSMVDNLIMPLISYITPSTTYNEWHLGKVMIGRFLADILNFLVIAAALFFIIVKIIGYLIRKAAPPPGPAEPTTKECPMCLSVIPLKARKCAHCTADLEPAHDCAAAQNTPGNA